MLFDRENITGLECLLDDAESRKDQVIQASPSLRFQKFNDKISDSGFRTIFRGYDRDSGCEIAWNVVPLNKVSGSERKQLIRRINQFKSFSHPNFVKCISWWVSKSRLQLVYVTELVTGGSLDAHLTKIKPPKLKIIKDWCLQLLDALAYYHRHSNAPRAFGYLRCSKIMINSVTNQLKISGDAFVTHSLQFCRRAYFGAPQWLPPEVICDDVGMHTDVYCFGMTLLQMLTLHKPYHSSPNPVHIYSLVQNKLLPTGIQDIADHDLKQILLSCLAEAKSRPTLDHLYSMEYWRLRRPIDNTQVELKEHHCNKSGETSLQSEVSEASDRVSCCSRQRTFVTKDHNMVVFTLESPKVGVKCFKLEADKGNCEEELFQETALFIQRRLSMQKMRAEGVLQYQEIARMNQEQRANKLIGETFARMYRVYELSIKQLTARYNIKNLEVYSVRLKLENQMLDKLQENIKKELESMKSRPISYVFGRMSDLSHYKHKNTLNDTYRSTAKIDETLSLKKKISSITIGLMSPQAPVDTDNDCPLFSYSCSNISHKDSEPPTPRKSSKDYDQSQNAVLTSKNTSVRKNSIQITSLSFTNLNELKGSFSKTQQKVPISQIIDNKPLFNLKNS